MPQALYTDLYGVEMPDIELKTKSVALDAAGKAVNATFVAKKEWTASASEGWIHVEPASGDAASPATVAISADANTGDERTGVVVIKGGNVTDGLEIAVTQAKYVDPSSVSLKDFAQEFVKGLDVWAATVGTVESENKHLMEKGTAWVNVHFIPVGKTGGEYDNHPGNQHDDMYTPWKLNVNGTEYTSAQAWEIAIRGLLDMVLTEGQDYIGMMTSRNKPGYTHGDNKAFSEIMTATPSQYAVWGQYPWYEEDGVTYNGAPVEEVGVDVITKATLGHLVRGLVGIPGVFDPLGKIGNFQEFGTSDSSLILEGYSGLISPMRELILLLRFYKYLLDNNIDQNVYSAVKDVRFDYDMYAQDVAPTPDPTIADFAQEFAKVADKWDANVGTVSYTRDGETFTHNNVHFVPENFVISLNGTNYDKFQMHEMAMRALKALEGGAAMTDLVEMPGSYEPATSPYHEYGEPLQEKVAKLDLLSNFATRCLNYLKNNGEWPNVCGYPRTTDPVLTNYNGYVCVERNLLMLSRLFRYMVKNNVTSLDAVKDVEIDTELWGEAAPVSATIKEFAQEYVKILDIWQKTTGEVVMHPDVPEETVANAHYVPENTTITVGGKTYNTADMFETALRSYLLIRGYNGLETEKYGKNSIPALEGGAVAMSTTQVPETHGYYWGSAPFNETKGNGGHLVMGTADENEHCKVKTDILDNWAMRSLNFQHGQAITNLCGYSGGQLDGYYGCFCSQRALLTYAFFFKYMLDHNLDKGTEVSDDVIIRSELLGDETEPVTIKDFAQEYVKILDIWEKTTGPVTMYKDSEVDYTVENAHYVPGTTTITVGGKEYNTADMWETALRSYLLIRGYNGLETEKYGKNSIPALEGGAVAMSTTPVPETHDYYFGSWPYNETPGNGGHLVMGTESDNTPCQVRTDILDNWAMRSLNFQHGQAITNLCGYAGGQLDGYYGCFCSQRALLTYAFFFKYMLDNKLDKGTEVSDSQIIRSELFGDEK